MELQWVPSHVSALGEKVADTLAMNVNVQHNPAILLKHFAVTRLLIRGVMRATCPVVPVSSVTAPPPITTLRRARQHQLYRLTSGDCFTCGVQEYAECVFFFSAKSTLGPGVPRLMTYTYSKSSSPRHPSLLVPTGRRSACRSTFELIVTFLHLTDLTDHL